MMMLWQGLNFIFRPRGFRVYIAVFIAHEAQLVYREGDRFCADAKKAADIDDHLGSVTQAMHMRNFPYFLVFSAINDGIKQGCLVEFALDKRGMG
jgi:hypothetical protein